MFKNKPCAEVEFDDLETFEHSKMKPLSVIAMVETGTRKILGYRVAQMPSKGHLARKSREKYGSRKDERKKKRQELFSELKFCLIPGGVIKSLNLHLAMYVLYHNQALT